MDKQRRRILPIATFTAITYLYGAADTRRPPPVIPVLTTIPARPQALTELRSPSGLFPGIPLTHGPPHGCLRTHRPPPLVAA